MKYSLSILFLLASLLLNAQVDSLDYYKSISTKRYDALKEKAFKYRGARKGLLAFCVDSNNRPVKGIKVDLIRFDEKDSYYENILATGFTDSNGFYLFKFQSAAVSINFKDSLSKDNTESELLDSTYKNGFAGFLTYSLTKKEIWAKSNERRLLIEKDIANRGSLNAYLREIKNFILHDSTSKTIYILDSTQTEIKAIDSLGMELWNTNPRKDATIENYRFLNPIITSFYFERNIWTGNKEVIFIGYNNSQFGSMDKKTGKFTFHRQD